MRPTEYLQSMNQAGLHFMLIRLLMLVAAFLSTLPLGTLSVGDKQPASFVWGAVVGSFCLNNVMSKGVEAMLCQAVSCRNVVADV